VKPVRRVLLVVWWFDAFGGMERHVTELALALAAQGVDVGVASEMPLPAGNRYRRQLAQGGVRVISPPAIAGWIGRLSARVTGRARRLGRAGQAALLRLSRRIGTTPPSDADVLLAYAGGNPLTARFLRRLRRECRDRRPDVLHVHGCRAGQAWITCWARQQGIASVYTEHTTIDDWGGPFDAGAPAVLARYADALVCVSTRSRASLLALLPESRAVGLARHVVREPRHAAVAAAAPRFDLVSVARLEEHKGLDVLIEALARLPGEVTLAIAGEGSCRAALDAQVAAAQMQSRVTLLGHLPEDEVDRLLRDARIFVLPSRTEGLPIAIIEAFAHGLPVVASRTGGVGDWVRDGENGLLVAPGDPAALAAALQRMLADHALRERLGAAARRSFDGSGSDPTSVAGETLALYRGALERACARRAAPRANAGLRSTKALQ